MAPPAKRKTLEKKEVKDAAVTGNTRFYCCRCGQAYGRQKGNFPVSHSPMYRGSGYLPMCSECVETLYDHYRTALGSDKDALRRICMKLDLYWNEDIYKMVERTTGVQSRVRNYIGKTNIVRYIDKTFDDTIAEEEEVGGYRPEGVTGAVEGYVQEDDESEEEIPVPDDVALFWGPGYTPKMYMELEERRKFWMTRFPEGTDMDIGTEALIRQICNLEIDINHDRAAGKSIDKSVNALNNLLGSANLKPTQRKEELDATTENTPMGVWIRRFEDKRPIPEPDPDMQDVDGIIRYITIWFLGHICKMLGIRNTYCKLYEQELEKMRIQHPEYADEDDEAMFDDIFGGNADDPEQNDPETITL